MPIERYRDVADVPAPAAVDVSDPNLLDRVFVAWSNSVGRHPPLFPAGLRRYGSLADAAADREAALVARMRRRRGTTP